MIQKKKGIDTMKTLREIKHALYCVGIEMTDDEFKSLTYLELMTMLRKAKKAHRLYMEVDDILHKPKALAPTKK
jgi:hypothetical protein